MLPVVSAIYPISTGAIAPPAIVMMSKEEASLVWVPASLNANEKMGGNMMFSPKYKAKNAMRDMIPLHTTTINVAMHPSLCLHTSHHNVMPAEKTPHDQNVKGRNSHLQKLS